MTCDVVRCLHNKAYDSERCQAPHMGTAYGHRICLDKKAYDSVRCQAPHMPGTAYGHRICRICIWHRMRHLIGVRKHHPEGVPP